MTTTTKNQDDLTEIIASISSSYISPKNPIYRIEFDCHMHYDETIAVWDETTEQEDVEIRTRNVRLVEVVPNTTKDEDLPKTKSSSFDFKDSTDSVLCLDPEGKVFDIWLPMSKTVFNQGKIEERVFNYIKDQNRKSPKDIVQADYTAPNWGSCQASNWILNECSYEFLKVERVA